MGDESKERSVARRLGFTRPRSPLGFDAPGSGSDSSVAGRLGLRPGSRVALVSVIDPAVIELRTGSSFQVSSMVPLEPVDVIVLQAENAFALRRLTDLSKLVTPSGVLWVLWPTEGSPLTRSHIERACAAAGMKCTWSTGVTGRLSGLKFIHRFADGR